ncbi:MAG: MBOAT family protein [Cytophagales bacterium]|nr:MBOAT family protein [Cytophagales bacterium]
MLFNSLQFLIFLPAVIIIYFSIPYKWRWLLLLIASYYFYMCWKVEYIILIIISTLIDFYAGIQMGKIKEKHKRRKYLYVSLLTNLGLLFGFKYFNFFSENVQQVFDYFNIFYNVPLFNVLLPVGISFYTFQTLSYTIDIYNGKAEPQTNLGIFALYVSFFPQLVAGPIERSQRLLPQFFQKFDFDYDRVKSGLLLMLWGFFKKLVIADSIARFVDTVYNNPEASDGITTLLATYFFGFQIYCDFSGYSDIAIGAALIMGYKLMENFRRPYFSQSIGEFWKRWHISLSTWFRDYFYIQLGGNRVVKWRWYYNLIVVFLVSGLWHGANWTFLIWGGLHGFYLVFSLMTLKVRNTFTSFIGLDRIPALNRLISIFITFNLVMFAWIFFRSNSLSDALIIISNIAQTKISFSLFNQAMLSFGRLDFLISIAAILLMEVIHIVQENKPNIRLRLSNKPVLLRWGIYTFLVMTIILFGKFGKQAFIYFQF